MRDLLESSQRVKIRDTKSEITRNHELAGLIGLYMMRVLNKDISIPEKWDQYPELFADEQRQYEAQHKAEDIEEARISRREYAETHNRRRKNPGLQ